MNSPASGGLGVIPRAHRRDERTDAACGPEVLNVKWDAMSSILKLSFGWPGNRIARRENLDPASLWWPRDHP
jgi:hypothetical protein